MRLRAWVGIFSALVLAGFSRVSLAQDSGMIASGIACVSTRCTFACSSDLSKAAELARRYNANPSSFDGMSVQTIESQFDPGCVACARHDCHDQVEAVIQARMARLGAPRAPIAPQTDMDGGVPGGTPATPSVLGGIRDAIRVLGNLNDIRNTIGSGTMNPFEILRVARGSVKSFV